MQIDAWITYFLSDGNWIIPALILWLAPWKIAAMYRAARRGQWLTFVLFFLLIPVNTLGIVEMFYLFSWSRQREIEVPVYAPVRKKPTEEDAPDEHLAKSEKKFGFLSYKDKELPPTSTSVQVPTLNQDDIRREIAGFKGTRRGAPEMRELTNTEGVGKIELSALSELERMRTLAREREEIDKTSVAKPKVPKERQTVRPDIPIPRPPAPRENKLTMGIRNTETKGKMGDMSEDSSNMTNIMPGVYMAKKKIESAQSVSQAPTSLSAAETLVK
ncbi:MAG: hypothetical protein COV07_02550 [Candidatus Vogelbacteria bacterium CG10_big_fil_rev_8_21_14_0_10_45_14]|uniref:DUF5652 domain-containing protein n=1 Tax=Candidatus Vogelbacteria bacterium CG10_big_fil_rev_8_21_14_0_10_45_14 TaxID=1975042 RepID=A0A2H0RJI3_9BACT|nr:MAG: hypothetical protein COV07_02550 [Candidatus Vogelbacteria bacterium CG10_big_fil_rev_8_21_14_0_10_45_14]